MPQQCAGEFLLTKSQSFRTPTQEPVHCSCNLYYGSMRRIMRSCSIGAHKAKDPVPFNSDYILVVSNRCHHNSCSCSHGILPLPASSTPSLTAQQFRLDRGVLCSVPVRATLSMIACFGARVGARCWAAVGRYLKHISGLVVGSSQEGWIPLGVF